MGMNLDPSIDAEAHARAQDDAADAEVAWWLGNERKVLSIVHSLISSPHMGALVPIPLAYDGKFEDHVARRLVATAAAIVMEATKRGEPL
jgi:hypothetical protein